MNYWYKCRKWIWLIAAIPACTIIIWPESRWINLIVLAWIGVICFIYYCFEKKRATDQLQQVIKSTQKLNIQTINHYRHDWMNDLQVLFGYISLGKKDKCIEYVDKIKGRMSVESQIAKLEEPSLVTYLQSFRIFPAYFELKVQFSYLTQDERIKLIDENISELIIAILNLYRRHAGANAKQINTLTLLFEYSDDGLIIHFLYKEELQNIAVWQTEIEQQAKTMIEKHRLILNIQKQNIVIQLLA